MKVKVLETKINEERVADIKLALLKNMPKKSSGWHFTWRSLFKTEGCEIFTLTLETRPTEVEGILMLTLMNNEMLTMNNIEIAPHNYGSGGTYDNVAGCLIAFGCYKSFELGEGDYSGYLTFESKTKLIPLYQEKYGATLAVGKRMFIEPEAGLKLIDQYLSANIPKSWQKKEK